MATNLLVAGKVACGNRPQANANISVTLIRNNRPIGFSATTTSDSDGEWAVPFDIGAEIGEALKADITVACPNGSSVRRRISLEFSRRGVANRALRVMLDNIKDAIISALLGVPIPPTFSSLDFAFVAGYAGTLDCCPRQAAGGGTAAPQTPVFPGGSGGTAEDAARRAEEERRRAEEERRRAEEERRRAEDERRRAEDERRKAEDAARRAEEAARRAEAAARPPQPVTRTRICFDLSGTAAAPGRAGITVSGVTVTVDVETGDTAETILSRLAALLRARGFTVEGPKMVPGTSEFVLYVTADPLGRDPAGGGIGAIDVAGLSRFSVTRQRYVAALAQANSPAAVNVALMPLGGPLRAKILEIAFRNRITGDPTVARIAVGDMPDANALGDMLLNTLGEVAVVVSGEELPILTVGTSAEAEYEVTGLALIGADAGGGPGISAGGDLPPRLTSG
jgi:hypothetical protein